MSRGLSPFSWDEHLYIKGNCHTHIMIDYEKTLDIIFGRWKSQILYAGVKLRVFDCITSDPKKMSDIAKELNLDFELTYRLLRALGSLGFLKEGCDHKFSISKQGELTPEGPSTDIKGSNTVRRGARTLCNLEAFTCND